MTDVVMEARNTFAPLYRNYMRHTPAFRVAFSSIYSAGFRYVKSPTSRRRLTLWTIPGGIENVKKRFWYYDLQETKELAKMYKASLVPTALMDVSLPDMEVYEVKRSQFPTDLYVNGRCGAISDEAVKILYHNGALSTAALWPLLHRSGLTGADGRMGFSLAEVMIPLNHFERNQKVESDLDAFVNATFRTSIHGYRHGNDFVTRRPYAMIDDILVPGGTFRMTAD